MREREYNDLEKLGAPERNATTWKRERVDAAGGVGSLFIYIYILCRGGSRALFADRVNRSLRLHGDFSSVGARRL